MEATPGGRRCRSRSPEDLNSDRLRRRRQRLGIGLQTVYHTDTGGESWSAQLNPAHWLQRRRLRRRAERVGGRCTQGPSSTPTTAARTGPSKTPRTSEALAAIAFVDDTTGWISRQPRRGTVHTEDGGDTWTPSDSGARATTSTVHQLRESRTRAGSRCIPHLHTSDGGATWIQQAAGHQREPRAHRLHRPAQRVDRSRSRPCSTPPTAAPRGASSPCPTYAFAVASSQPSTRTPAGRSTAPSTRIAPDGGLTWQAQTYDDVPDRALQRRGLHQQRRGVDGQLSTIPSSHQDGRRARRTSNIRSWACTTQPMRHGAARRTRSR